MLQSIKNIAHLLTSVVAAIYFRFPGKKLTVIGVTGTDGKTTTSALIHHILTVAGIKTGISSTLASPHTTTPGRWRIQKFLWQSLKSGCTHVVLEVTSIAIDQHRVWGVPFEIGVLTNISDHEHLDYHKTFENYKNTKLAFLKTCKHVVLWEDYKKFRFETKLIGKFNQQNCLAAIGVAKTLGISDEIIRKAVASFEAPIGRLEVVIKKPFLVIVDFAHTPQAFEKVLPEVKKLGKRLIHVFGCTGDRDKSKRPIMGEIATRYDDEIILTSEDTYFEDPEKIMDEVEVGIRHSGGRRPIESNEKDAIASLQHDEKTYYKILDRRNAIKKALEIAKRGDVVIITGVGHQKSLNIGGREIPWSDQKVVLELMNGRKN